MTHMIHATNTQAKVGTAAYEAGHTPLAELADGDKGGTRKPQNHERDSGKPPLGQLRTEQHLHEEGAEELANSLEGDKDAHSHGREFGTRQQFGETRKVLANGPVWV